MRRVSLWVLLGIFFLAPGGFYLWAQPEAPQAIILDGFSSRSLDTSLWQIAPEKPSCLQSDGAARLTYQPGGSYSRRENITSKVPLPGRYVVQVNMVGGVQVVEMAPAPLRPAPSVLPLATGYGTPSAPAAPSLQPMAGQPGAGASYSRQPQIPTGSSPTQQIRQFAQDAIAREKRGAMTVTGHYIKPTFYASGPQVGVSLQGQNFRFSVAFRGIGEPKPADEPGLAVFTARGTGEQQVARIDIPAGQWVPLRLEVDGAKVVVKVKGQQPIEATLPVAPTSLQIGDLGPEGKPFSVQERVEYLIDDVRVYAGSGPDLPPDDYLADGDWFLSHQHYANAAIEFKRATVAAPNHAGAQAALAYARAFSQGAGKTLPEAKQATADSPDSFLAHYYLGRFYLDMMRYDYAAKELTKALDLAPDSPSAHTWLGLALFRREARFPDEQLASDSEALGHLEAATRLLPSSAEAHQALGLCLLSGREVKRAQDELVRALELDQGLFDARLVLTSLMEPTRFSGEQTLTNSRLLVEGNPSYPPLLLALLPKEAAVAPTTVPTATPRSPVMIGPGMTGPGMTGGPGAIRPPWMAQPGATQPSSQEQNFQGASSKIAFYSERDGNREIYVMNPDGSNQTRLTNNPAEDSSPCWSPYGSKMVFHSYRDGVMPEIYVMNSDGTNQTNLTNSPAVGEDWPSWSPDGSKITFDCFREGNRDIYVMNPDGTNQTRLTDNPTWDSGASWSPDGRKIVFMSARDGNNEIYVMNANGTNQTRLTSNPANDSTPSWSPDGSKIAFQSLRDGNGWQIYVMNSDGTSQTRLTYTTAHEEDPSWSPDGSKIAFCSWREPNQEIYVMNADGTDQVNLTHNPARDGRPYWSPLLSVAPTVRPPGAVVEGFEYFRRANQWRDNGMLRPAVEEYRRWLGILVTQGKFDQVAMGAEEMTKAYRAAGLPAMEAYALYLPAEPRNTEEWPQTTAYVSQRGGEFNAAKGRAMAGALTPDQRAWLTYIKGVMQMATTSPTPGWREAIDTFKSVDEMVFWPRRGDALIHMGSCYLAIKRPYLAEQAFERALKVYQDEASRLAALGVPVASSEDRRLQTRILNCARYVNLAREQDGKLPKYDTGGVVVGTAATARPG